MSSQIQAIGHTDHGQMIERIAIQGGGLSAWILTHGATVQDLRLDGFAHPLVLGSPSIAPYFGEMNYFGALVGRFANRIAGGRFSVAGREYATPRNWLGRHCLHGGSTGTAQRLWTIESLAPDCACLGLTLADGEMGFPGRMQVRLEISLPGDGALQMDVTATTDASTPCSFAHHGLFNLDGGGTITGHELWIDASAYLPVDDDLIPTGEIAPVDGTKFDFRNARSVGDAGLDHNFCLSPGREPSRAVAVLRSPANGLSMTVETTEPGLQVYDGANIPKIVTSGLDRQAYGPFAGIALETQNWPDAPNHSSFPNAILNPGETYRHQMRYVFR